MVHFIHTIIFILTLRELLFIRTVLIIISEVFIRLIIIIMAAVIIIFQKQEAATTALRQEELILLRIGRIIRCALQPRVPAITPLPRRYEHLIKTQDRKQAGWGIL